jgi:hypothetical protein
LDDTVGQAGQIASSSVRQIRSFPQKAVGHEQRSIGIA